MKNSDDEKDKRIVISILCVMFGIMVFITGNFIRTGKRSGGTVMVVEDTVKETEDSLWEDEYIPAAAEVTTVSEAVTSGAETSASGKQSETREKTTEQKPPEKTQAATQVKSDDRLININTASEEELTELSGIGEVTARAIIEYRNGKKFGSIEEIMEVKGIGEKKFEKIKDRICV